MRRPWIGIGGAAGVFAAAVVVGAGPLRHVGLVDALGGDAGSSLAAVRAFAADNWRLPFLSTARLRSADGRPAAIGLIDGVPLLALAARLVPLGAGRWMQAWYAGCLIAQGLAAGAIARALDLRRLAVGAALIAMLVASPVLLVRVVHPGLFAQWTLLAAWAAAIRWWRRDDRRALAALPALALVALLAHPYLWLMVVTLVLAVALDAAARHRLGWFAAGGLAAATIGASAAVFAAGGYLAGGGSPAGGYGAFGMPLASPVWPQRSGILGQPFLTNSTGSIEGFNSWGLGATVLVVVSLALGRDAWRRSVERLQVVAAVLAVTTAVAVTPVIYVASSSPLRPFGATIDDVLSRTGVAKMGVAAAAAVIASLATLALRPRARRWVPALATVAAGGAAIAIAAIAAPALLRTSLGTFRSSGRLFWMVTPGVISLAALALDRWIAEQRPGGARPVAAARSRRLIEAVAVAALIVQIVDTRHFLTGSTDRLVTSGSRSADLRAMAREIRSADAVHLPGAWQCADGPDGLGRFQDVVIAATLAERPIDNVYEGRLRAPTCPVPIEVSNQPGVITAIIDDAAPVNGATCRAVGGVRWCRIE